MTNTITGLDGAHELLIKLVDQAPDDWTMRKKVAQVLYDARYYRDASQMIWSAPEIPPIAEDVVFAAKIVAKGQPTRAMRLINTIIEKNLGQPEENLAMAKLFMKADMPLQAVRMYGAAVALDAKLIDDRFEVRLLKCDVETFSWNDEVMSEDFPWEGPQVFEETATEEEKEDAHAALLNGLTQPVPLRAAVSETRKEAVAVAEPEQEHERERNLPVWKVQEGRATFDPTRESAGELELPAVDVAEVEPPAEDENLVEFLAEPIVESISPSEPEPNVSQYKEETQAVDLSAQEELVEKLPETEEPAVELPSEHAPAFFKSYDDAHQHQEEVVQEINQPTIEVSEPAKPVAEQFSQSVEKEDVFAMGYESPSDDLADYVAEAMAEYGSSEESDLDDEESPDSGGGGVFSSLVNRFRKKKPAEEIEEEIFDETDLLESTPVAVSELIVEPEAPVIAEEPVIIPTPEPIPAPAEMPAPPVAEAKPSPLDRPGVHTSAQKLITQTQPAQEEPRELDGRTQLVALAPEDGRPFFERLIEKYRNVQPGQVPTAVAVARDMANADYLKLIHQACEKDLDSFSKLLGLHRTMAANNCTDWGEDMNLLRKGYGDAVLATVVSKYSVSECREILNSVYQHPASAAAV